MIGFLRSSKGRFVLSPWASGFACRLYWIATVHKHPIDMAYLPIFGQLHPHLLYRRNRSVSFQSLTTLRHFQISGLTGLPSFGAPTICDRILTLHPFLTRRVLLTILRDFLVHAGCTSKLGGLETLHGTQNSSFNIWRSNVSDHILLSAASSFRSAPNENVPPWTNPSLQRRF